MQLILKIKPTNRTGEMFITNLLGRHLRTSLLTVILIICGFIALAGTKVLASINNQAEIAQSNPHHIPDELNPKLKRVSEYFQVIHYEAREDIVELKETLHSAAFKSKAAYIEPILDYTTGTSN